MADDVIQKIDPRNSKLLRHLFNIVSTKTNPDNIDLSAVIPVIDMGQGGWASAWDHSLMRSASITLQTQVAGSVSLSHIDVIMPSPATSTTHIYVPPGHDLLLCKVRFEAQIEEFPWLVAFAGRYLRHWLSVDIPDGNTTFGTSNRQLFQWDMQIRSFQNLYNIDFKTPVFLPEGTHAHYYVAADNTLAGYNSYGSWRVAGQGMDLPVYIPVGPPPQIALFNMNLWGILLPHGVQFPAACVA